MPESTCSTAECDRSVFCRGWCRRHWQEWRNTQPGRLRGPRHGECTVDGCGKPHKSRGYCSMHRDRLRRTGDPLKVRQRVNVTEPCSAEGCERIGTGGNLMCSLHYQRWKAHGGADRIRPTGDNRYESVDLLTGRLTVVRINGAVHVFTYDLADHDLISRHRWHVNNGGYAYTSSSGGRADRHHVLLHRMLLGLDRGDKRIGDHVNGDRTDNRRSNLRVADHALNAANQAIINDRGTSKYRGVCWDKSVEKWKAYGHVNGRLHNLGFFLDEDEAAGVAFDFRAEHHADIGYPRRHAHTPTKGGGH